jgi:hypothetical protein
MNRQRIGHSSSDALYHHQLLPAMGKFLPHRGLALETQDNRVRWTDRLLAVMALLMAWQAGATLKDRFEACWQVVADMYPSRRRGGHTYEGFIRGLGNKSECLLQRVAAALRKAVQRVAGDGWKIGGWVVMGVDGSRINCPRTRANEQAFGCAGRDKTGPQQLVTTVLHVGSGLIWDWRRGTGKAAERNHLRDMIATLPAGSLLLADAGFTGYDLLKELIATGRSFVIRAGAHVSLLTHLGYAVGEHDGIVYLWPQAKRDREPLILRMVVVNDGRRGVYLLTNVLDESRLADSQVARMYSRRWGIEVFYRSLKQTLQKRKMLSTSPDHASVELDWAMAGLWMLGLLTVERLDGGQGSPSRWSAAKSLRVIRRVMSGRGSRWDARDLRALSGAGKDAYRRLGSKTARDWPAKKKQSPPKPPIIRVATDKQKQQAQRIKARSAPIPFAA